MNKLGRLFLALCSIIFMSTGLVLIFILNNLITVQDVINFFEQFHIKTNINLLLNILGAVNFLLGLIMFQIIRPSGDKKKAIVYKTDKGEVRILLGAIEDYIVKVASRIKEVRDIKTRIKVNGKNLKVYCKVLLKSEGGVAFPVEKIQERIEEELRRMLGIEINISVNVNIVKVSVDRDHSSSIEGQQRESLHELPY